MAAPPSGKPPAGQWSGVGAAWNVIATMLAGLGVWGGLGLLADRLFDTGKLFLATGLLVGMAGAIYLIYWRYGRDPNAKP